MAKARRASKAWKRRAAIPGVGTASAAEDKRPGPWGPGRGEAAMPGSG